PEHVQDQPAEVRVLDSVIGRLAEKLLTQAQPGERANRVELGLRQVGQAGADRPRLVEHELEGLLVVLAGQPLESLGGQAKRPSILLGEGRYALRDVGEAQGAPQPIRHVAVGPSELAYLVV